LQSTIHTIAVQKIQDVVQKKYGSSGSTGASGPYKAKFTAGYPKIDLFVQQQLTILLLERRTD
jgi:hypothetical protein